MPNIPPNYTLAFDATFAGPLSSHITSGFGPIVSPTQWITHTPNATDFGSSQFGDATGALNPYTVNASNQLVINCFSQGFVQGDAALTASTTTCDLATGWRKYRGRLFGGKRFLANVYYYRYY